MTEHCARNPGCDGQHSAGWQIQDAALQDLMYKCVEFGMTQEQARQVWWIVASAFNRLDREETRQFLAFAVDIGKRLSQVAGGANDEQ